MSRRHSPRTQMHEASYYEDITLLGEWVWCVECTCGWDTHYCRSQGQALGLFRRHLAYAGRS